LNDSNPLISIITITFNSEKTLSDTIESILNQSYKNIEYIIVDGKSMDGTLEIIDSYSSRIKDRGILFRLLSEKDKGIGDAWNKGLKMVTGKIVGMLNSDDWYDSNTLELVSNCLNPELAELSYGICKRLNEKKELIEIMQGRFQKNKVYLNFGFSYTTCFLTQKVFDEIGGFNIKYKIAIDSDFLLRCLNHGIIFKRCFNVTYMRLGGVSTKFEKEALYEYQRALSENGYNKLLIFVMGKLKKYMLDKKLKS